MAKKQDYLHKICTLHYGEEVHSRLSESELRYSDYFSEIMRVYRQLGGILFNAPTRVGKYDIDTPNFMIELDEENHFNRYRLCTLESSIYTDNCNLDVENYRLFCSSYEGYCRTDGNCAMTASSEKQFGISSIDGDFLRISRTRWKQRAFYDFLKDVTSIIIGIPIIRISIYEEFEGQSIKNLIKTKNRELLIKYIDSKLSKHNYWMNQTK